MCHIKLIIFEKNSPPPPPQFSKIAKSGGEPPPWLRMLCTTLQVGRCIRNNSNINYGSNDNIFQ